mmetsp:Transcript_21273/g.43045  ORF Transcript_21273/g.43045 Transcript_21273/m.43045 type:complete len:102 (+) Transcript_21273:588-893(+)
MAPYPGTHLSIALALVALVAMEKEMVVVVEEVVVAVVAAAMDCIHTNWVVVEMVLAEAALQMVDWRPLEPRTTNVGQSLVQLLVQLLESQRRRVVKKKELL